MASLLRQRILNVSNKRGGLDAPIELFDSDDEVYDDGECVYDERSKETNEPLKRLMTLSTLVHKVKEEAKAEEEHNRILSSQPKPTTLADKFTTPRNTPSTLTPGAAPPYIRRSHYVKKNPSERKHDRTVSRSAIEQSTAIQKKQPEGDTSSFNSVSDDRKRSSRVEDRSGPTEWDAPTSDKSWDQTGLALGRWSPLTVETPTDDSQRYSAAISNVSAVNTDARSESLVGKDRCSPGWNYGRSAVTAKVLTMKPSSSTAGWGTTISNNSGWDSKKDGGQNKGGWGNITKAAELHSFGLNSEVANQSLSTSASSSPMLCHNEKRHKFKDDSLCLRSSPLLSKSVKESSHNNNQLSPAHGSQSLSFRNSAPSSPSLSQCKKKPKFKDDLPCFQSSSRNDKQSSPARDFQSLSSRDLDGNLKGLELLTVNKKARLQVNVNETTELKTQLQSEGGQNVSNSDPHASDTSSTMQSSLDINKMTHLLPPNLIKRSSSLASRPDLPGMRSRGDLKFAAKNVRPVLREKPKLHKQPVSRRSLVADPLMPEGKRQKARHFGMALASSSATTADIAMFSASLATRGSGWTSRIKKRGTTALDRHLLHHNFAEIKCKSPTLCNDGESTDQRDYAKQGISCHKSDQTFDNSCDHIRSPTHESTSDLGNLKNGIHTEEHCYKSIQEKEHDSLSSNNAGTTKSLVIDLISDDDDDNNDDMHN